MNKILSRASLNAVTSQAVETETIQKNAACPKSPMSRGNLHRFVILFCMATFVCCNSNSNKSDAGKSEQKSPTKETISKNISGRVEVLDTETNQTSFQNTSLSVDYVKTTTYRPDGSKTPTLNFNGYRGYPKLTIAKCSFLNDQSMYVYATCNESGVYETEWLDLQDTDENLRTSTWAKIKIRFKSDDFFSGNPY